MSEVNYETISERFSLFKSQVIYITNAIGELYGCISKGDFLRSDHDYVNINTSPNFLFSGSQISSKDKYDDYNSIPIIDPLTNKLIKVIEKASKKRNRQIKFIAEIGNNHQGDVGHAFKLIESAKSCGADYVKFQARNLDALYVDTSERFIRETDYATAYTIRQIQNYGLSFDDLEKVFEFCRSISIEPMCTPFDEESALFLLQQNLDFIKISSADLSNFQLLEHFKNYTGQMVMSTGMHDFACIKDAHKWANDHYVNVILMHTNSTYPTPYTDINLRMMPQLKNYSTSGLFGYSGHERGWHIPLATITMGASLIEKHFTFDRNQAGNDHKVSLLPSEFASMVNEGNDLIQALNGKGQITERKVSQGEALNQISLSKGVYSNKSLKKGSKLSDHDIELKSPCVGLVPSEFSALRDFKLVRALQKGEPLERGHFINEEPFLNKGILGNFGVPCRVRDIDPIFNDFNPSFLEYHLFATDLELDLSEHRQKFKGKTFSFHAPEQFDDGFVLDLVNEDDAIRDRSFQELNKIIHWVLEATAMSEQTTAPKLITNVGGASYTKEKKIDKEKSLETLAEVNNLLQSHGIEFRPQTMPPFPWHFGGQGFHNLFVDFDDVLAAQKFFNIKICLDLSHSWLSMQHLDKDFYEELSRIKQFVDYVHVADAIYPGEEGIQLGTGEINMRRCFEALDLSKGNIMWIPEIWKGHMDNFRGFKNAMRYLESETCR